MDWFELHAALDAIREQVDEGRDKVRIDVQFVDGSIIVGAAYQVIQIPRAPNKVFGLMVRDAETFYTSPSSIVGLCLSREDNA